MGTLVSIFLLVLSAGACSKSHNTEGQSVSIYRLASFNKVLDTTTNPGIVRIQNAVADSTPLVSDTEILFYNQQDHTFTLSVNIKPALIDFGPADGFVVKVGDQPVYYGTFHPAYLSSILFGSATIDPLTLDEKKLKVDFALVSNASFLQTLDRRNDPVLIAAFKNSGRLR